MKHDRLSPDSNPFSKGPKVPYVKEVSMDGEVTYREPIPYVDINCHPHARDTVISLSASACKMFSYVMVSMKPEGYVFFDRKELRDKWHLSPNTIRRALNEMTEARILEPAGKRSYYWVNPFFLKAGLE